MAEVLADRGELDELRARADAGDSSATSRLAGILADRGELDELRARADAGNQAAASRLAGILASRGDLDELRGRTDAGDQAAARPLTELLAGRGNLDQALQILRAQANSGHGDAQQIAGLLTQKGYGEEAKRLRQFGLNPDGSIGDG